MYCSNPSRNARMLPIIYSKVVDRARGLLLTAYLCDPMKISCHYMMAVGRSCVLCWYPQHISHRGNYKQHRCSYTTAHIGSPQGSLPSIYFHNFLLMLLPISKPPCHLPNKSRIHSTSYLLSWISLYLVLVQYGALVLFIPAIKEVVLLC